MPAAGVEGDDVRWGASDGRPGHDRRQNEGGDNPQPYGSAEEQRAALQGTLKKTRGE